MEYRGIVLAILFILLVSGCTTETPAPPREQESTPAVVGEDFSRRDNTSGAESFAIGGGVDILNSDLSFDEIAVQAYEDTFTDIPPEQRDPDCNNRANQASADACFFDAAVRAADPVLCEKISTSSGKVLCIRSIALDQENTDTCALNATDNQKYNCIAAVAIALEDASLCSKIPETNAYRLQCTETIRNRE